MLHRRLAVTGLENGRQPLYNEDGTIWLCFNGEIYNHELLREELNSAGHVFRTSSDGEVIIHLYETYGIQCLQQLDGEFAFALFDCNTRELWLARDRFGIKPLYYAHKPGAFYFASELKAIVADTDYPRRLDRKTLQNYLHTFFFSNETLLDGIRQVKPAHFIRFHYPTQVCSETPYWSIPLGAKPVSCSENEAIEEFNRLFREAVARRLPREVPFGAYLSGGLDSSILAATIKELTLAPAPVFSIGFEDRQYDESADAAMVANTLNLPFYSRSIGSGELQVPFIQSIWHSEMPVLNPHGAAKQVLARLARPKVKVVLTGEGADELFWGYGFFQHLAQQHAGGNATERLSMRSGRLSGSLKQAKEVVQHFGAYPYAMQRLFFLKYLSRFLQIKPLAQPEWDWKTVIEEHIPREKMQGLNDFEISQLFLLETDFPSYLLNYLGDRQEMAAGLEARLPFLDHRLASFACSLPVEMKLGAGQGKYLLRRAFRNRLPESVLNKPKQAFYTPALPVIGFFSSPEIFQPYLRGSALEEAAVFNRWCPFILKHLARVVSAQHPLLPVMESLLVFILSYQIWRRMFLDDFEHWFATYCAHLLLSEELIDLSEINPEGHLSPGRLRQPQS